MSPILYLVIPIAGTIAAAMAVFSVMESHSKINGMEGKIRELEQQRYKATQDRDEWKTAWNHLWKVNCGLRERHAADLDRLKAENESLVASVNYWKNATKAAP